MVAAPPTEFVKPGLVVNWSRITVGDRAAEVALITGAEAVPVIDTFVPAVTERTPEFDTVTAPVPPLTPIPDPATKEVTPVFPTVTFPVAPDTLTPEPATRPVTPALDKPRVVEPGTETNEIPPALERAFENTKLLAVGSETETPAPVAVLMFTVERALDRLLNCPTVGNKKEGTTPLTLVAVKFGSRDIYTKPLKISC
jgi:hypothetical protein